MTSLTNMSTFLASGHLTIIGFREGMGPSFSGRAWVPLFQFSYRLVKRVSTEYLVLVIFFSFLHVL
jgi:hypothetical protein